MMAKGTEVFTADQMYGIWVTYNAQGSAFYPVCSVPLDIEAEQPADVAKDDTERDMHVRCPSCERTGTHTTS